jgi:DNA-binding LytR/AlgR family response regulator
MTLNCIIVDDDEMATAMIRQCVEKTDFLNLIGVCNSAMKALHTLKENKVDLIFLDVEMPELSGLEFIKHFPDLPQIILITSSKEYAAEAFDYNVTGYVLKPIDYSKFLKSAMKARDMNNSLHLHESGNDIFIKKDSRLLKISTRDILWVEAMADYVILYTSAARHTVHSTMKAIENKLNAKEFVRIHRSFIVRIDQIKSIEDHHILIGDKLLPIGASYKDHLFRQLNLL